MGYKEISFYRSICFAVGRGELFFGGYKGYNSFIPEDMEDIQGDVQFAITDIKIFNRSISTLPLEVQREISPLTPCFYSENRVTL